MALRDWTRFKGVTALDRDWLSQNVLYGVIDWAKWALLNVGGYQNIGLGHPGFLGGDGSALRSVTDPNFTNGQVWEGFRSDWVWETGIDWPVQPVAITGVWVNNTFSTDTGAYPHYIDYPRGRVVFNNPLGPTDFVHAEFSHRTLNVVKSEEHWFQELMYDSYRYDRADYMTAGSGNWDQLAQTRRQMPVVGVELVNRRGYKGYQLGGGQWVFQDILFYVCAENSDDARQYADIFANQNDMTIWIPNRGLMKEDARYPIDLDYRGVPLANPMQFPQIVAPTGQGGFQWRKVQFTNTHEDGMEPVNNWLYRRVVRSSLEIIMENI